MQLEVQNKCNAIYLALVTCTSQENLRVSIMCDKCTGESRPGNITFDYYREYCT